MIDETLATKRYVLGACSQLGFKVTQEGGVYHCAAPEEESELFEGRRSFEFSFEQSSTQESEISSTNGSSVTGSSATGTTVTDSTATDSSVMGPLTNGQLSSVAADSPLVNWLSSQLNAARKKQAVAVLHAQPSIQPTTVHELSDRLFAAYTIDQGSAHLAGCRLEDRPFVCLTFKKVVDGESHITEMLFDQEGRPVEESTVSALRLTETEPVTESPPRLAPENQEQLFELATQFLGESDSSFSAKDLLAATLIWCKWAAGKLCFTIGEESIELPFEDWAATLAAPAFACLAGGKESFHLAATDDGRITAAEAIAVCEQSQRRVLEDDLVACSVTGRRVLREYLVFCDATEKPLLQSERVVCPGCRLQVSPAALLGKGCLACQRTAPVRPSDARLARVLGEHPGLGRWWSWQLAETPAVYIVRTARLLRCLLIVLDKQTLETKHLALGNRFSTHWTEVPQNQWEEYLR